MMFDDIWLLFLSLSKFNESHEVNNRVKCRNNLIKPEFEGLVFSQCLKNTDNNT